MCYRQCSFDFRQPQAANLIAVLITTWAAADSQCRQWVSQQCYIIVDKLIAVVGRAFDGGVIYPNRPPPKYIAIPCGQSLTIPPDAPDYLLGMKDNK